MTITPETPDFFRLLADAAEKKLHERRSEITDLAKAGQKLQEDMISVLHLYEAENAALREKVTKLSEISDGAEEFRRNFEKSKDAYAQELAVSSQLRLKLDGLKEIEVEAHFWHKLMTSVLPDWFVDYGQWIPNDPNFEALVRALAGYRSIFETGNRNQNVLGPVLKLIGEAAFVLGDDWVVFLTKNINEELKGTVIIQEIHPKQPLDALLMEIKPGTGHTHVSKVKSWPVLFTATKYYQKAEVESDRGE